jgi:hypothetical protein
MNRRELLISMGSLSAGPLAPSFFDLLMGDAPAEPATRRTRALARYEQMHLGVSYQFSMSRFTGDDYETGAVPATTYNPTHLDVRHWIRVAHDLGARYAVLTAKHMSGFCLWDCGGYDYDVAASGNKTDVVAAFVAACVPDSIAASWIRTTKASSTGMRRCGMTITSSSSTIFRSCPRVIRGLFTNCSTSRGKSLRNSAGSYTD